MVKECRITSYDGTRIYYTYRRKGLPWLVFLHGGTGNLKGFFNQEEFFLRKNYSLLFIDLRGHGKSDRGKTKEFFSFKNFALDVKIVLDTLRIRHAVLVGHCFGSLIAQEFVSRFPDRVDRLILIDSGFEPFRNRLRKFSAKIFARLISLIPVEGKKVHPPINRSRNRPDINPLEAFQNLQYTGSHTFLYTLSACAEFKCPVSRFDSPVLLMHGKKDRIISYRQCYELQKVFPNSRVRIVQGGHLSLLTIPEEVNRHISDFLTAASTPSRAGTLVQKAYLSQSSAE